MALTRGTVGVSQTTAAAGEEKAFDTDNGDRACTTMCVRCRSSATSPARVRIPPLHGSTVDVGAVVLQGEREYFRLGAQELKQMFIGGVGGVTTVDWAPVSHTVESR